MNGDSDTPNTVTLTLTKEEGHLLRDMVVYSVTGARQDLGDSGENLMAHMLAAHGMEEAETELILAILSKSNDLP